MPEHPQPQRVPVSFRRKLAFQLLCLIFRIVRRARRRTRTSNHRARSAVIVEPFGLGDAIAIEPAVNLLLHNGYSVTIASRPPWHPLFPDSSITWLSIVEPWTNFGAARYFDFVLNLIRRRTSSSVPTIGIDPRGDIRSLIVLAALGCERIVTFDHYVGFDVSLNLPGLETIPDQFAEKKKWQCNVELVSAAIAARPHSRPPDLRHLLSAAEPGSIGNRIGLIPVAPWPGKSWPADSWRELSSLLQAKGHQPVILAGPNQVPESAKRVGDSSLPILEGKTLVEFANNLDSCQLIVSVDTGPMHLASALGIPVIGLFGTGQVPLWAPTGRNSRVVTPHSSPPKAIHQTVENASRGIEAMRAIAVADVLCAIDDLFSECSQTTPMSSECKPSQ